MTTQEFQATVNKYAEPVQEVETASILDELEQKLTEIEAKAREIGLNGSECTAVRSRLLDAAERRWMRTRYASLDLAFAQKNLTYLLARKENAYDDVELRYDPNGFDEPKKTEVTVLLPEFVEVWDSFREWKRLYDTREQGWSRNEGRYSANNRNGYEINPLRVGGVSYSRKRVFISTKYPDGITDEMFKRMRKVDAFNRLFRVSLLDRGIEDDQDDRMSDDFGLLWCPKPETWVVSDTPPRPEGDPAILYRSNGTVYLVGYFDTPDERSIDNLIREFSQGPLPKKGKK